MQTELEIITRSYYGQSFHIHNKFIDYETVIEITNEREMIQDDADVSDLYPFFMKHDELVHKIEIFFPNIKWKTYGEFGYTKRNEAIIELMIIPEKGKNEVRQDVYVHVTFTDRPFDDLKDMCRTYGWNLWHLNSFEYLNVYDKNECEPDCINFPISESDLDFEDD